MTDKKTSVARIGLADPLWTVAEVAEATGISAVLVRKALNATKRGPWLPLLDHAFRKGGDNGPYMIRRSQVERWVREMEEFARYVA